MTGNQFKRIREGVKKTQSEIATMLDVSLKTVSNWEHSHTKIPHHIVMRMQQIDGKELPIEKNGQSGVPILPVHTTGSVTTLFKDENNEKPLFYIDSPDTKDCDYGVRVSGDSMHPLIRNGGYVACKSIHNRDHILYGEVYHIVTSDYSTIKYIKHWTRR